MEASFAGHDDFLQLFLQKDGLMFFPRQLFFPNDVETQMQVHILQPGMGIGRPQGYKRSLQLFLQHFFLHPVEHLFRIPLMGIVRIGDELTD